MIQKEKLIHILKALFKQDGKDIYDYQLRIAESDKQFTIINKSRQIGISYLLAAWGLVRAIFNDDVVLIISPSERQSKHLMRYAYDLLALLEKDFNIRKEEETKTSLIFASGGAFYSLPSNPRTVRGFAADVIIFDEFAHFLHGTDGEIWDATLPSISRGGHVYIVSTPFGRNNLFCELWHKKDFEADRITINWRDCPDLDIGPIRASMDEMAFAEEYDNHFHTESEQQEFPEKLIMQCINPGITLPALDTHAVYIGGIDVARTTDMTAFAILKQEEGNYTLAHYELMRNVPFKEQAAVVSHYLTTYNFAHANVDATWARAFAEGLSEISGAVREVVFTHDTKLSMVLTLKRLMQNGCVSIPDDPMVINSIRAIRRKYTDGNVLKFESERRPDIGHADLFWAMALAVYGAEYSSDVPMPVKLERW